MTENVIEPIVLRVIGRAERTIAFPGGHATRIAYTLTYPQYTGTEPCATMKAPQMFDTDIPGESPADAQSRIRIVRKVCDTCHSRAACAEWGIASEQYGIWGGLSPKERRLERHERRWALPEVFPEMPLSPTTETVQDADAPTNATGAHNVARGPQNAA